MPPRKSQVTQSQPHSPTATAQTQQAQTCVLAVCTKGESFNLSDISGSDDDDDIHVDNPNSNHPHNHDTASTSQAADAGINNSDLVAPKSSTMADVHYFFERDEKEKKMVCIECR